MIRRVSSRQRLVSWDAFDATANQAEVTSSSSSDSEEEEEEEEYHQHDSIMTVGRKRDRGSSKKLKMKMSVLNSRIPAFPWEFASFQPQPIDELPEDVFLFVTCFLDLPSIRNLLCLNHKFRHLLLSSDSLWRNKCRTLWQVNNNCNFQDATHIPLVVKGPNCPFKVNLPLLISMTPAALPTKVDESMLGICRRVHRTLRVVDPQHHTVRILERQLTPDGQEAELIGLDMPQGHRAIQYTGRVGAGDRCIRSNHPLPRPRRKLCAATKHPSIFDMLCRSSSTSTLQGSCLNVWRPFCAPHVAHDGSLQVGPRMVAYFEVSILENPAAATHNNNNGVKRDCVAVGVATESFSCQTRMPGWDAQSFGYHGDDGGTFHASGAMLERFGPCFGTGDTVGCGIDYVARGIFFTLNGKFLGYGWKQIDSEFLEHDLYGVVGIDTNDPVTVNYGSAPFQFNLSRFISKHDQLISHQYQHTSKEEDYYSELADLPSYPEI